MKVVCSIFIGVSAVALLIRARRRAHTRSLPSRYIVRPATAHDVEAIARCWSEAYQDQGPDLMELDPSFLAERTLEGFRPRAYERVGDTLVACDEGGAIVGLCVCVADEVEQFFLSARARGAGVSELLLERGEELLRARGSMVAHLYCMPKNERAMRFYGRCGWRRGDVHAHAVQISGGRTFTLHLMRFEKALRAPPRLVVLTGGSGVGKTTLIERLAAFGHPIVPEAAMQVIAALNGLIGPQGQLAWRTAHKAAFGELLGAVAMAQEAAALSAPGGGAVVFLDRSVLDNLGYARVRGYEPPSFLTPSVVRRTAARLERVFVLDSPSDNHEDLKVRNEQSGRSTDPGDSRHVSGVMHEVYSSLGCETEWLPALPPCERLDLLLARCGLPPATEGSRQRGTEVL